MIEYPISMGEVQDPKMEVRYHFSGRMLCGDSLKHRFLKRPLRWSTLTNHGGLGVKTKFSHTPCRRILMSGVITSVCTKSGDGTIWNKGSCWTTGWMLKRMIIKKHTNIIRVLKWTSWNILKYVEIYLPKVLYSTWGLPGSLISRLTHAKAIEQFPAS